MFKLKYISPMFSVADRKGSSRGLKPPFVLTINVFSGWGHNNYGWNHLSIIAGSSPGFIVASAVMVCNRSNAQIQFIEYVP